MTMHIMRRSDLDSRVEQLADRLGLRGSARKTETIGRALSLLEERVGHDRPSRAAIVAALDRYIDAGARLHERLAHPGDGVDRYRHLCNARSMAISGCRNDCP